MRASDCVRLALTSAPPPGKVVSSLRHVSTTGIASAALAGESRKSKNSRLDGSAQCTSSITAAIDRRDATAPSSCRSASKSLSRRHPSSKPRAEVSVRASSDSSPPSAGSNRTSSPRTNFAHALSANASSVPPSARSSACNISLTGSSGSPSDIAKHQPGSTKTSSSATRFAAAVTNRDLPTPASPTTSSAARFD